MFTKKFLEKEYLKNNKSFATIAKENNTYPAKVRREAIKFGIKPKSKSEAQKAALKTGIAKHPTKGKKRTTAVKEKISNKVSKSWENLSQEEYDRRVAMGKLQRENMTREELEKLQKAATKGIQKAAKDGSQMERYLYKGIKKYYNIEFHREKILANRKLHLDLFIPELSTAIEVNGPSHFLPIWGYDVLSKTKKTDNEKAGLLVNANICLLKLKHLKKNISQKMLRDALKIVLDKLAKISQKFPTKEHLLIELEI